MKFSVLVASLLFFVMSPAAHAKGGGGHSLNVGLIFMSPSQDEFNTHIGSVNRSNNVSIDKFSTATEFFGAYIYRFSGSMFGLNFRPSFFTQTAKGNGYTYSLTGYTFFPMFRLYPLENNFIRFFMQVGVGYGNLTGKVEQPNASLTFSGGQFGAAGGLGSEFCFTDSHCMVIEGTYRYLPIQRSIASASSGTLDGFTQAVSGSEVEMDGADLATTMSGIQGGISYLLNF